MTRASRQNLPLSVLTQNQVVPYKITRDVFESIGIRSQRWTLQTRSPKSDIFTIFIADRAIIIFVGKTRFHAGDWGCSKRIIIG